MSTLNFDATRHDPNVGFDPIPAGDYVAMVTDSDVKPTKANTGSYLQLTWEVLEDGPYKGRKIWQRMNIQNQNKQAEEIGMRELSNVCHAVGVLHVQDSAELHNRPCVLKVKYVPADGQYSAKNEVSSCEPVNGGPKNPAPAAVASAPSSSPGVAAEAAAPAQEPIAAAGGATPPWKR